MTLKADAAQLLERLRNAHRARTEAIAARKHGTAHAAATIAQDLVDDASPELLRAALTAAVQPDGGQPPIPVVLGPQDAAAATVGVDEVMGLVEQYVEACRYGERVGQAYGELNAAVTTLATAAFVGEVGRAHSEGRLS